PRSPIMTIKPPERRPPTGPISSTPGKAGADAPERAGTTFRDKLDSTATGAAAQANPVAAPATAGAADSISELAAAVRAGTVSADQAIERLVERSVGSVARGLSLAQREELAQVLRDAVQNDPALRELREALG